MALSVISRCGESRTVEVIVEKKLVRVQEGRMFAGVCAGLAAYFGVDPTLVRVLFVLATLLGFGSAILVYLILWIVMPQEA